MNKSNRRKFIATATVLAAGTAVTDIPSIAAEKKAEDFPVVHHVFFWLKNPSSKKDLDQLVAGVKTLSAIETVHNLRVGVVASTEKRDVVDNSWAVSELIFFKDLAGQSVYQTHPIHLEFIKNCGHLWEKVIVYDAVNV
ncbi:stress responsive alpha-beta barrel domain-containing protein [Pedobacter lusitanus]|uniref:Stress responsive alpha-beta barrel domain-containing protein n=1 Tax=Pedobacter lusitanus TaxID=1503925 RepID=A0A0D0GRI3_9SPHI|nr:Dabb family protein [Pedobacter lusitanus]KIO77126.1 stress responsive alpha-beta barrel domain-containing protein [Pedobacter lusitanus]